MSGGMTRKERRLQRALEALRVIADMRGNGAAQVVARIALKDCRKIKQEGSVCPKN